MARFSGAWSAVFFLLTGLLVFDGLQALMRDDFSRIDLPLGGQALMSGAMPLQAKVYTDIVADIKGLDGLSFTPLADFKGFWLGAHMWRAMLDARNATTPGRAELTIVDLVPAKSTTSNATITVQNPTLIYAVTVWPSEKAMQAAHFALSHRLTGLSAFVLAVLILACGTGIAIWHFFVNQTAHRALAAERLFVIHGVRKTEAGYLVICMLSAGNELQARQPVSLLSPDGAEQGKGVLQECSPHKGSALLPLGGVPPRYGWLLRYEPDTRPESEHKQSVPA